MLTMAVAHSRLEAGFTHVCVGFLVVAFVAVLMRGQVQRGRRVTEGVPDTELTPRGLRPARNWGVWRFVRTLYQWENLDRLFRRIAVASLILALAAFLLAIAFK